MYKREQNLNILTKNKINLKINTINVQLTENYITLKKKTEDRYKWKDSPHSRNKRINIVKMSIQSKEIYRFKAGIFHRNRVNTSKICMEPTKTL